MAEYYQRHEFALETLERVKEQCGVTLLDPIPLLCSETECKGDTGGLPIYFDDDHLNERGGEMLVPLFKTIF